jgi:sugar lactone lactonase YvrE/Tfp pilus assembly protein PilE
VELLIVIVVIAILASIILVVFHGIMQQAAASSVRSDLIGASTVLQNDRTTGGSFPGSAAQANSGAGLRASSGNSFYYTSANSTFCLTEYNSMLSTSYYVSDTQTSPTPGTCGSAPSAPSWQQMGAVTVGTLAGASATGYVDGTGSAARFNTVMGIAVDGGGNAYVADSSNNRIRKITPAGVVTTFAGSGVSGFADGTGTAAQFAAPRALAFDGSGNLLVADTSNSRIRQITPAGVVTTLAGSGTRGFLDGSAASAQFNMPSGIAVDGSGNVYIGDTVNSRIRKIAGGVVSTFAGSGLNGYVDGSSTTARFFGIYGLAVDGAGNVYAADTQNNRIRVISSAGDVTTLAGSTAGYADGTGAGAQFNWPDGVALDGSGNVYVTDHQNNNIRKINSSGVVTTYAGSGTSGYVDGTGILAQFRSPDGIAVDGSGYLYVSEMNNGTIRKITH